MLTDVVGRQSRGRPAGLRRQIMVGRPSGRLNVNALPNRVATSPESLLSKRKHAPCAARDSRTAIGRCTGSVVGLHATYLRLRRLACRYSFVPTPTVRYCTSLTQASVLTNCAGWVFALGCRRYGRRDPPRKLAAQIAARPGTKRGVWTWTRDAGLRGADGVRPGIWRLRRCAPNMSRRQMSLRPLGAGAASSGAVRPRRLVQTVRVCAALVEPFGLDQGAPRRR